MSVRLPIEHKQLAKNMCDKFMYEFLNVKHVVLLKLFVLAGYGVCISFSCAKRRVFLRSKIHLFPFRI